MENVALIALEALVLALGAFCVLLERKLFRLERSCARLSEKVSESVLRLSREIGETKGRLERVEVLAAGADGHEEEIERKLAAEKRFSEGIASIIAYDSGDRRQK